MIRDSRVLPAMTVTLEAFRWRDGLNLVAVTRGFSVSLLIRHGRVANWVVADASGRKLRAARNDASGPLRHADY